MAIKFEKVSRFADIEFDLPVRKTSRSAGYDMVVAEDITIPTWTSQLMKMAKPQMEVPIEGVTLDQLATITKNTKAKPTLVSTGVKCILPPDAYLELSVRSSTPLKYWLILANGVGIIDADYANSRENEGEIFFQVINLSPFPIQLKRGDIIGQGIIKKYETTDDDNAKGLRNGGFGSTSTNDATQLMAATMAMPENTISSRGLRVNTNVLEDACGMRKEDIIDSIQKAITNHAFHIGA